MSEITLEARALGAYLGAAVGDALGATVEFMTRGEISAKYGVHREIVGGGWLKLKAGETTDDTAMALATFHATPERVEAWTLAQAWTTHRHPLSDDACLALVRMTHDLLRGEGREAARGHAEALIGKHRSFRFAPYPGRASGFVVDTMQTVLHGYFGAEGFEDCLVAVVSQGDDADTTGAIAGMLAGATYGLDAIPPRWLAALDRATAAEIRDQTPRLLALG